MHSLKKIWLIIRVGAAFFQYNLAVLITRLIKKVSPSTATKVALRFEAHLYNTITELEKILEDV